MIGHILKKDVRRLWPAILGTLAALAALAWHDRWRSDWMPGATESYLNALMPVLWAFLIGLVVEQEPIAGDRQFWLTRPYRRGGLLAAKLLFVALSVHLPLLAAQAYVLASRGFSPLEYAPELLKAQVVLAFALSIPAMALASLVRSFAHYVLEIVAVATVLLVVNGSFGIDAYRPPYTWEPYTAVRQDAVILCAAAASIVILGLQYLGRRIALSRGLAAASAAVTIAVFSLFLPQTALAVRATTRPATIAPSIRLNTTPLLRARTSGREVLVSLPIVVTGFPEGSILRLDSVQAELVTVAGEHYRDRMQTRYQPMESKPFRVQVPWGEFSEPAPQWIWVQFDAKTYAQIENGPITLRGELSASLIRLGEPAWMGVGDRRFVPGAGWCYSSIVEDRFAERIKLECESPRTTPTWTRARLWSPETGRDWRHRLGAARTPASWPRVVWLSPLDRDQTFWDIVPEPLHPTDIWRVPAGAAPTARIEITPQTTVGYSSVRYEFRDLDLRKYRLPPVNPAGAR